MEIAEDAPPKPLIVHLDKEQNEDLYDAILTVFKQFKDNPLDERPKIPKLKWSAKSKKLTVAAGKEAAHIAEDYDILTLVELNSLYYATGYTVSLPKSCSSGKKKPMPDISYVGKLIKQIEFLRKKLGKYMAINLKEKLSDRDTEFLQGKDCEEMIVPTKIKLAAVTCRLLNDPPTKDEIINFWTKLFGKTAKHNNKAAWFQVEEESVQHVQQ
eukprot:12252829-Ditylum_brightwellii.AAC.1